MITVVFCLSLFGVNSFRGDHQTILVSPVEVPWLTSHRIRAPLAFASPMLCSSSWSIAYLKEILEVWGSFFPRVFKALLVRSSTRICSHCVISWAPECAINNQPPTRVVTATSTCVPLLKMKSGGPCGWLSKSEKLSKTRLKTLGSPATQVLVS